MGPTSGSPTTNRPGRQAIARCGDGERITGNGGTHVEGIAIRYTAVRAALISAAVLTAATRACCPV